MDRFRDTICIILLGLVGLLLLVGCRQPQEETDRVPLVTLIADGQERHFQTRVETVGELLAKVDVELGDLDRVEPAEYIPITDGMTIQVVRVRHEVQEGEPVIIPYEKKIVQDTSIPVGESRILDPGQNGLEQPIYRVVYEDGVEVERVLVRRVTLQEAHPETVLVGAREAFTPTPITGTIAYLAGTQEVGYNAWVMRGSSGSQRRLTFDGTLDTRVFALSPDGGQLLFTRRTSETLASGRLNSLWRIDTTVRGAEPVDLELTDVLWADWSPDGERVAYSTGELATGVPGWQAYNDLWVAELNSQDDLVRQRQVIEPGTGGLYGWWGTSYAWSPDDRYIAYAQASSVGVIRVRDGEKTELRRIEPYNTRSQWVWVPQFSWSPDSRFLSVVLHGPSVTGDSPEDSQVFDLWTLDIQRPLAVKQVNEAGMWAAPAWSPSFEGAAGELASRIAYGRATSPYESNSSFYELYVMDRDGSNRRRVFPIEGQLGLRVPHVAWGPTGQQLITVYQNDLYLVDLARDLLRRLTVDGNVHSAVWTK